MSATHPITKSLAPAAATVVCYDGYGQCPNDELCFTLRASMGFPSPSNDAIPIAFLLPATRSIASASPGEGHDALL